jgi:hypothetical protein
MRRRDRTFGDGCGDASVIPLRFSCNGSGKNL